MSEALLVSAREGYGLWAATFDRDPSAVVALESRVLQPLVPDWRGRLVADVGCGTGRWSASLAACGASVFGFDLCPAMLALAAGKPGLGGRVAAADTVRLPLRDASADGVICALTLGHLSAPEPAIAELARIARPGATVLLSDFHPEATRRGWKRTFRAADRLHQLESHAYGVRELLAAAARMGLESDAVLECGFGELERPIFARVGRADLFDEVRGLPAVLAVRWHKRRR